MSPSGEYVQIHCDPIAVIGSGICADVRWSIVVALPGLPTGLVPLTGFDGGLKQVSFVEDPVGI